MKRFLRCVCLILVLSLTLAIPTFAAEATPRASNYFGKRTCYLWNVSSSGFDVWFEVVAVRTMIELGASTIKVQRSTDTVNWSTVRTYTKAYNPGMTTTAGTAGYNSYVTFDDVDSGYYYRAYVEFYARDSSGSAVQGMYTSHVYIP